MKQKVFDIYKRTKASCLRHQKLVLGLAAGGFVGMIGLVLICNGIVEANKKYVLGSGNHTHMRIGLVLGAGITKDGKPFKELQGRLDGGADALARGQVDKLIVSGDNRFKNYSEPDVMLDYLISTKHVAASRLQPDYAGRSTYESCERAAKIFDAKEIIIFSARSHLPRAIYLCRHFGIEAYGNASGADANNSTRRELLARVKAVYNIYIHGEHTLRGEKKPL